MQKIVRIVLMLSLVFSACSTARKAGRTDVGTTRDETAGNGLETVLLNNLTNNDFYIRRADIKVRQENVTVHLNASIKFRRPDSLMISVRSGIGVEAGKGFLTGDTVIVNDRFNRKLMVGDPEEIRSKYGIDPALIYVILGDMIVEKDDYRSIMNCQRGDFRREYNVEGRNVEYTVDCQRRKLRKVYLEGDFRTGNITILLSGIVKDGNITYPEKIVINDDLKELDIEIEIKRMESPWSGSIGTVGGQGYRVVKIR
ncbi:MAG: DUF4292 domain-containing protein [Bacteroidales bacterium]|nr:DUF4292 domain-containing protein [Bacteroidales bacterium]